MLQLIIVEVTGAQWHHETAQTDQRGNGAGEQADDYVVSQDCLGRLFTILNDGTTW